MPAEQLNLQSKARGAIFNPSTIRSSKKTFQNFFYSKSYVNLLESQRTTVRRPLPTGCPFVSGKKTNSKNESVPSSQAALFAAALFRSSKKNEFE